jgi:hypothetical protein
MDKQAKSLKAKLVKEFSEELDENLDNYLRTQDSGELDIDAIEAYWVDLKLKADARIAEYFNGLVNTVTDRAAVSKKKAKSRKEGEQ